MLLMDTGFSPAAVQAQPLEDSLFFCFHHGQALLFDDGCGKVIPCYGKLQSLLPDGINCFCLGQIDGKAVFCPNPYSDIVIAETERLHYCKLRISDSLPLPQAGWLYTAWHLWSWYRRSRYCGLCGANTRPAEGERAVRCEACGQMFYPVISPAVIIAITSGDYLLQVKTTYGEPGRFSLVAGYVEAGETLEHAVRREAMEEVGLELTKIQYLGNQPWGYSGTLMFAFHATADRDAPLRLQESEIADARWIHRSVLTPGDNPVSVSCTLIERFLNGEW